MRLPVERATFVWFCGGGRRSISLLEFRFCRDISGSIGYFYVRPPLPLIRRNLRQGRENVEKTRKYRTYQFIIHSFRYIFLSIVTVIYYRFVLFKCNYIFVNQFETSSIFSYGWARPFDPLLSTSVILRRTFATQIIRRKLSANKGKRNNGALVSREDPPSPTPTNTCSSREQRSIATVQRRSNPRRPTNWPENVRPKRARRDGRYKIRARGG